MSDHEKEDDLFGDGGDNSGDESHQGEGDTPAALATTPGAGDEDDNDSNNNNNDGGGMFGDEDDDEDLGELDESLAQSQSKYRITQDVNENVGQKLVEITVPRYPTSHVPKQTYLSRLPAFLSVEPHPFDSSKFLEDVRRDAVGLESPEEVEQLKLQREHTMRWKYSRDDKGGVVKESNARFVKWDDGSISLQVGDEMFDVEEKEHQDTFLAIAHTNAQLLQSSSVLDKTMTFVPTSTSSEIHRRITQQLAKKQLKGSNVVGNFATKFDPEAIKRQAEEEERQKLKERRKQEAKLRAQEEREGGFPSHGGSSRSRDAMDYGGGGGVGGGSYEDEYEDDDFVVSDDENAQRLSSVKTKGARRYQEREDEDDEEEEDEEISDLEEDEGKEEEKEQEDSKGPRKKRRIVDDDDDDE